MTTPGYPGRPQAAKLGLKPGQRVRLHHPPDGWALSDPPAALADPGPETPGGPCRADRPYHGLMGFT